MAKARPKIPGGAGTASDPDLDLNNRNPIQRKPVFEKIGNEIIKQWRKALQPGGQIDRTDLEREIGKLLRLDPKSKDSEGDPAGQVEIGIIVDPKPESGTKFIWIVIPYPEYPASVTSDAQKTQWLDGYDAAALGESVLFGCGR